MFHRLLLLLACLPALLVTSCVEGEEEIWINPDGSGNVVAHFEIPSLALRQIGDPADFIRALELVDEAEDGIKITNLSFSKEGLKAIFHLEATFEDATELLAISSRNEDLFIEETGADPENIRGMAGNIVFEIKGLTPTFSRIVRPADIFPPIVKRRPQVLRSASFKYTVHLPAKIKETNAHEVSDDGKTVSWTFLLKDHFESPIEMSFTTQLPVPWWAWVALGLLIILILWLVWRFIIRRFV